MGLEFKRKVGAENIKFGTNGAGSLHLSLRMLSETPNWSSCSQLHLFNPFSSSPPE